MFSVGIVKSTAKHIETKHNFFFLEISYFEAVICQLLQVKFELYSNTTLKPLKSEIKQRKSNYWENLSMRLLSKLFVQVLICMAIIFLFQSFLHSRFWNTGFWNHWGAEVFQLLEIFYKMLYSDTEILLASWLAFFNQSFKSLLQSNSNFHPIFYFISFLNARICMS